MILSLIQLESIIISNFDTMNKKQLYIIIKFCIYKKFSLLYHL